MTKLNYRPLVSFDVSSSGIVSKVKLIRSSGSSTLDEKALRQISSYRYPRHNCGACKMSMTVGVDFQGPVWMRETYCSGSRRPLTGRNSAPQKAAGLQRVRLHCPLVCAGFLLGGACDRVFDVTNCDGFGATKPSSISVQPPRRYTHLESLRRVLRVLRFCEWEDPSREERASVVLPSGWENVNWRKVSAHQPDRPCDQR